MAFRTPCMLHACSVERRAWGCRGAFDGDEAQRLSLLKAAAQQGVRYIDVDLDAADSFLAGTCPDHSCSALCCILEASRAHQFFLIMCLPTPTGDQLPEGTDVIVTYYSVEGTPDDEQLRQVAKRLQGAGGSVARIVTTATDVIDSLRLLALLREHAGEYHYNYSAASCAVYAMSSSISCHMLMQSSMVLQMRRYLWLCWPWAFTVFPPACLLPSTVAA
jgi:Type I 3-dehydroquinase